jgi:hypothetical protein
MDPEHAISEAFENAFKVLGRDHTIFEGKVISVDPVAFTAAVQVGDSVSNVIYDPVYLEVLTNTQGSFLCIPSVGSYVVLCFRDANLARGQILKTDSADKYIANPKLWQFGDGTNGGLPMVNPLTEHLNTLENDRNNLKDAIAAWTPVPNDGGAALKIALATWLGVEITPTQVEDLANPKVTQ